MNTRNYAKLEGRNFVIDNLAAAARSAQNQVEDAKRKEPFGEHPQLEANRDARVTHLAEMAVTYAERPDDFGMLPGNRPEAMTPAHVVTIPVQAPAPEAEQIPVRVGRVLEHVG